MKGRITLQLAYLHTQQVYADLQHIWHTCEVQTPFCRSWASSGCYEWHISFTHHLIGFYLYSLMTEQHGFVSQHAQQHCSTSIYMTNFNATDQKLGKYWRL